MAYLELPPLHTLELPENQQNTLWLRGGFPNSLLASSDAESLDWRQNLSSTYLERELPSHGSRLPAQTLRRLWTMLAHPVVGNSWEGFAIETLLDAAPCDAQCGFSRSSNGAQIDLVIDAPSLGLMVI